MLISFPFPETPMTPRIPSAAKTRPSPHPVARPHLLCRRLLTLPTPTNTHIHILHHSHPHRFRLASRPRAQHSATCHPCTAITCRLNSKRRLKIIHIPVNHHRTQHAPKRLSMISKGPLSLRGPNRPSRWLAQPSCRQPILTTKGTKCLCSFLLSVSFPPYLSQRIFILLVSPAVLMLLLFTIGSRSKGRRELYTAIPLLRPFFPCREL